MISASDPAAIMPFRGQMLKIFAAVELVTDTKRQGSIFPVCQGKKENNSANYTNVKQDGMKRDWLLAL